MKTKKFLKQIFFPQKKTGLRMVFLSSYGKTRYRPVYEQPPFSSGIRGSVLLSLFLLSLASCASTGSHMIQQAYHDEINTNEKLIQDGHGRQAIEELGMLLQMDPKNYRARFLRALALQKTEKFPEAITEYEELLRDKPDHEKAHFNLGMIHAYYSHEKDRALFHLNEFLMLQPTHEKAFSVAKIMCSLDEERKKDFEANTALQTEIQEILSIQEIKTRRIRLQNLLGRFPESPALLLLIGQSHEMEGNLSEASEYYREALKQSPTCASCHRALANLYSQKGKHKEAKRHQRQASFFDPNDLPEK